MAELMRPTVGHLGTGQVPARRRTSASSYWPSPTAMTLIAASSSQTRRASSSAWAHWPCTCMS